MTATQAWKPSFFNVTLTDGGRRLLFNSVSAQSLALDGGGQAVIDRCFDNLARTGTDDYPELLDCLIKLGFVVPANEDEEARERSRFDTRRTDGGRLYLTIAPTMACNMKCSYCFQRETPKTKIIAPEMRRALVEFARRKAVDGGELVVQWFGGEPLVAYDAIVEMTAAFKEICRERDMAYRAEMLTNGILLNPKRVAALRGLAICALQISLDGKPETYAQRREVPLPRAQAYYRFLAEAMPAVVDATGSVTIRINVDRVNVEEAKDVVALFKAANVTDQRIDFRLGFLNTSRGMVECIPHDCFSSAEFAAQEQEFRHYLATQGYRVFGMPQPRNYPCTAVLRNSFTIDPMGAIGKCVPAIGTAQSTFARLHPDDMDRTMAEVRVSEVPYGDFDPFSNQGCGGCRMLPVCLGSCPKLHGPGQTMRCSMKEGLGAKLAFYHRYYHEGLGHRTARPEGGCQLSRGPHAGTG